MNSMKCTGFVNCIHKRCCGAADMLQMYISLHTVCWRGDVVAKGVRLSKLDVADKLELVDDYDCMDMWR